MKIASSIIAALVCSFIANTGVYAETVNETIQGENAYSPDGGSAAAKDLIEVKDVADADGGKVARVKGSLAQWGFVNYWFGIPIPAGKVIIRLKIYVDDSVVAPFNIYTDLKAGQNLVGALNLPADAKKGTYVFVDVPITSTEDWSGLTLKKSAATDKAGPWIDSLSSVTP